jgi:hypothetical protein
VHHDGGGCRCHTFRLKISIFRWETTQIIWRRLSGNIHGSESSKLWQGTWQRSRPTRFGLTLWYHCIRRFMFSIFDNLTPINQYFRLTNIWLSTHSYSAPIAAVETLLI